MWVSYEGRVVPCDPQRRLVIFDGPYGANGLPDETLIVFCEQTGRLLWGRPATVAETKRYAAKGLPGKPFAIGRVNHWTETCDQLAQWASGAAAVPAFLLR